MAKRWGKGWEVGLNKSLHEQDRTQQQAAEILKAECGVRHVKGSRADLCPACIEPKDEKP